MGCNAITEITNGINAYNAEGEEEEAPETSPPKKKARKN